jgi:hypothetical protein
MRTDGSQRISMVRQVFPAWSVHIPPTFEETLPTEPECWHAWDEDRSLSLSSVLPTDEHGPVSAERIVDQLPPPEGTSLGLLPRGLIGWAVEADAEPSARALRALSDLLATDGRMLIVTITSDDPEWRRDTWLSIRSHPVPLGVAVRR